MRKLFASIAIGAFLKSQLVLAANIPLLSGAATADPAQMQAVINQVIQTINANVVGAGAGSPFTFGRNLLDNGDDWVNQRNATATCATTGTTAAEASYGPDRWMCDVNMASGAGQLAVVTSSPTPPQGYINEDTLVRNSGSLGQPVCKWQEVQTQRATAMQGQNVAFSVNIQALAGLAADNGSTAFIGMITGTTSGGADGLGGLRSAVGMTATVKASSATISTSTGVITNASAVVAGAPMFFGAATAPGGITLGQIYYVSSALLNSGTSFAVAPTYAQAIAGTNTVIPSTAGGTVTITLPKITPVWTGLTVYSAGNPGGSTSGPGLGLAITNQVTLPAATWVRVSTGPLNMPSNMTEAAVFICFVPNSINAGGATDGIASVGAQLEILPPGVTTASSYEFRSPQQEWIDALRYYYQLNDQAAHTLIVPTGLATTTAACELMVQFPEVMDIVPTYASIGTPGTGFFKILNGAQAEATFTTLAVPGTSATLASVTAGPVLASGITGTPLTAGQECALVGQGVSTTNALSWGADF